MAAYPIKFVPSYECIIDGKHVWKHKVSSTSDLTMAEEEAKWHALTDPDSTGRWEVRQEQNGKRYCYSRCIKSGTVDGMLLGVVY